MLVRPRSTISRPIAVGLTSGVLLVCATPYVDFGAVAFVALAPLFILVRCSSSYREITFASIVAGTIYGVAVLFPLFSLEGWWYAGSGLWWEWRFFLWGSGLFMVAVGAGGLFFVLFFLLFRVFRRSTLLYSVGFAVLWGVLEFLREYIVFGFTWGHLGYAMHESTTLLQLTPYFGVYGVSSFIVLVNMLIATTISTFFVANTTRLYICSITQLFLIAIIVFLFGQTSLQALESRKILQSFDVAVIGISIPPQNTLGEAGFSRYVTLINEALKKSPDIVVLPESIFNPLVLDRQNHMPYGYTDPALPIKNRYDILTNIFSKNLETTFIFGLKTATQNKRFNSMVAYENGELTALYDKRILIPFAERSQSVHSGVLTGATTRGDSDQSFKVQNVLIAPLVCSEIIYPRAPFPTSTFLVNISNEDMFNDPVVAKQNHIMAKFRAAENKQFLLRAVKDGYSSIITPTGVVEEKSIYGETGILFKRIHVYTEDI